MSVDSVDSAGAQLAPRSLDFGSAETAPTARVGEGGGAKLLPADASLADVASYLCDGAHSFDVGVGVGDTERAEDPTVPRRTLEMRQSLEARLGAATRVRRNQAEAIAAVLLGYDTGHLVWAGSGKTLIFETTVDSLVDSLRKTRT